ncbi:BldC family transcriptional regulator [Paractinoplanes atraurantiacus]|uniref:DNA binding domain-containing protein, excisionase family n=1 Tax=Paractinoplanes atraurantiacus TaxID=1036182 RepID=A0A285GZI7_9ACTN|nr:BldC family transcriptional regulator [Actinoplanes atraurantiacus]SNY28878.1 DNA binding domain-containing protein, excisionase family [Actinoplanes atraurantiacus]
MNAPDPDLPELLTSGEVARLFRVDPRTPARWAIAGRLTAIRTPGGHRRYKSADVLDLLRRPADEPPATS